MGGQSVLQSQNLSFCQMSTCQIVGVTAKDCDVGEEQDVFDEDAAVEESRSTTEVTLTQPFGAVQRRLCRTTIGGKHIQKVQFVLALVFV